METPHPLSQLESVALDASSELRGKYAKPWGQVVESLNGGKAGDLRRLFLLDGTVLLMDVPEVEWLELARAFNKGFELWAFHMNDGSFTLRAVNYTEHLTIKVPYNKVNIA